MLYDDQEDLLSLLVTHTQALAWVMNIVRNNDLVESEIALQVIDEMKRDSRNIWEEQLWNKIKDGFAENLPTAKIYNYSPESRGPDT